MAGTRFNVVDARLARPRLPQVLERSRLLDQVRTGLLEFPLTLITAGAGYGKTTLMASAAELNPDGTLWYSLGEEDADLTRFLQHIAAALQRHNRRHGRGLCALLREGVVEARSAAAAAGVLLNDFRRIREPLILAIDDLHLVSGSSEISQFLESLVENNHSLVHLMLATRTEPPLPLGRLRARRMIFELGFADLAFTTDEMRSFLEDVHHRPVSESELEFLTRFTEGWVTPIQLALQAGRTLAPQDLPRALERAMASGSTLHDYLAVEILDQQSPEWRRWILESSPFEEIEPDLLRSVLCETDPEGRLRELLRKGLIHAFESESGIVYRYHTLLRDLFIRRFRAEVPEADRERLHASAAAWFRRRGDLVAAARQLAFLDDKTALAEFLRAEALTLLDSGQYQALTHWLEQLPPELLDEDPWLRLRRGDARHFLGDWPGAELDYERAQTLFHQLGDTSGEAWTTLGLARLWNLRGQSRRAVEEGEAALGALVDPGDRSSEELEVRLLKVVSGAHYYLGQFADAIRRLDRLEELARGHAERQAVVWNNRAVVHASQGNYPAAATAFERGLRRPGARQSPRAALHLSNLGLLLNEMGDPERARPLFDEALRRARRWQNRSHILSALLGQAHLNFRLGNMEACLARLREADELNEELQIPLLKSDAMILRSRVLAEAGQFAAARDLLRSGLAAYGSATCDSHWLIHKIEDAVLDLRAGRPEEAHVALTELRPVAFELEALFPRMRLLFHRGEAARQLGIESAEEELSEALRLGRSLGYDAFLRAEFRRDTAPFFYLLRHGQECEFIARLAAGAGSTLELAVLQMASESSLPAAAGKAILQILGEIGGPASHRRIKGSDWAADGALSRPAQAAMEAIERRHPEVRTLKSSGLPGLLLTTLGPLHLSGPLGEIEPTQWRSQRALSIFLYLAMRGGRGVPRDRLVELFWPGRQRRSAQGNFHPTLSYIRGALRDVSDGPVVVVRNALYQLDPDLLLTIDAHRFEGLAVEGRTRSKPADRIKTLEEAVALYQGDFLDGRDEPWTDEMRTRLALGFENVLAALAALLVQVNEPARAIPVCRRLLDRSPYREEIHVRLMGCYNLVGDRHAILDQYRQLTRLLREDLGSEPLPETTRSYESLIAAT